MDWLLELVVLPVTDVDRARDFYAGQVGFRLDVDVRPSEGMRVVQLTPPGSACSVSFGEGIGGSASPVVGLHLVVSDLEAACAELAGRGVAITGPRHMAAGGWQSGAHPDHADHASFAEFADPDGNTWVLQERGWSTPA